MSFDFDLLVIGAGSGGVRASRMAAARGWKVAVVEKQYLGGTCVNAGCVPKKLFVYASQYPAHFEDAQGFGVQGELNSFDWPTLKANKNREIARLNGIYQTMLTNAGVTIINGSAKVVGTNQVEVDGKTYSAERILIATGGKPFKPNIPGAELAITSDDAFHLEQFPQRAVVVGGGYIAVEFAGIYNGLGAETHLLYRGDEILRNFDGGIRACAADQIAKKGVHIHTNTDIESIEKQSDGSLLCKLTTGDTMTCDLVLFATGRKPLVEALGLESVGVQLNKNGSIAVNEMFQTAVPSIYAIGDVIGTLALTPVALAQAMRLVSHWLDGNNTPLDYSNIPTAVFCQPNIATVGLTEEEAVKQFGDDITIFETSFRPMIHTMTGRSERMMMKLVVQTSTDKVIGAHMLGDDAGEIIQGLAVALKAGATKAIFDSTIGIHPTAAEEFVTMRTARAK